MNPFHNRISLYQLNQEKVTPSEFNIVSPSESGIRFSVADNLLIIHSAPEQLTLVYDVRSKISAYQIGPPQGIEIRSTISNKKEEKPLKKRLDQLKSRNYENEEEDEDTSPV